LPEAIERSSVVVIPNTTEDVIFNTMEAQERIIISDAELGARILKWKYWNRRQSQITPQRKTPRRIVMEERRADDLPTNEHEQRRELHQRRQLQKLISEMKDTSPIYNTLQRSLYSTV
jgi:hypothetical protein